MNNTAYFFMGDSLLLPADLSDTRIYGGISIEFANDFKTPDIFEIPAIDDSKMPIQIVSVLPETALSEKWKSIPVRQVLAMINTEAAQDSEINLERILRACHITQWRRDSRFCGTCGAENTDVFKTDIHRLCPRCGRAEYPRISPAVIVVITDEENRILLAHNRKFKEGVYSHISGFNEAGESLEETVVREVREEVNIEIKDITYVKSQSWPFPNSLMLGFKARYLSGTIRPDGAEIEDAGWFTKDNLLKPDSLPIPPGEGSLSRYLINCWLDDTLY